MPLNTFDIFYVPDLPDLCRIFDPAGKLLSKFPQLQYNTDPKTWTWTSQCTLIGKKIMCNHFQGSWKNRARSNIAEIVCTQKNQHYISKC